METCTSLCIYFSVYADKSYISSMTAPSMHGVIMCHRVPHNWFSMTWIFVTKFYWTKLETHKPWIFKSCISFKCNVFCSTSSKNKGLKTKKINWINWQVLSLRIHEFRQVRNLPYLLSNGTSAGNTWVLLLPIRKRIRSKKRRGKDDPSGWGLCCMMSMGSGEPSHTGLLWQLSCWQQSGSTQSVSPSETQCCPCYTIKQCFLSKPLDTPRQSTLLPSPIYHPGSRPLCI